MAKSGAKDSKPILVFAPATVATERAYRGLLRRLRHYYRVRVVRHRRSLPVRLEWSFFFADIDRVAPAQPFYLLGHSQSGPLVMAYTAAHSRRVRQAAVLGPVLFKLQRPQRRLGRRLKNLARALRSSDAPWLIAELLRMRRLRNSEYIRRLDVFGNNLDMPAILRRWRGVLLWQRQDETIPAAHLVRLRREFPRAKVIETPGSHLSPSLQPAKLIPYIRQALNG